MSVTHFKHEQGRRHKRQLDLAAFMLLTIILLFNASKKTVKTKEKKYDKWFLFVYVIIRSLRNLSYHSILQLALGHKCLE